MKDNPFNYLDKFEIPSHKKHAKNIFKNRNRTLKKFTFNYALLSFFITIQCHSYMLKFFR